MKVGINIKIGIRIEIGTRLGVRAGAENKVTDRLLGELVEKALKEMHDAVCIFVPSHLDLVGCVDVLP